MPVKTFVFTNVRKFDGDKFRWLSSGEYIQMSGRAGRRVIDERGICILMVYEKLEPSTAKMILKGSADSLNRKLMKIKCKSMRGKEFTSRRMRYSTKLVVEGNIGLCMA